MTNKILYVEDNFQNFRLVLRMLQREDKEYEVIRAENGLSGIKLAREIKPDLILMDINLPDIDGAEAARRLKADEHLSHIPVVALTANAMVGDRERYLEAGCNGYLRKPLSRADLRAVLAEFLSTNGHSPASPGMLGG
jgi:two-component system cell cycle response regulator DivK